MHIQTHILSGWCIANLLPTTPRQRLLAMLAASLPDLDGVGVFVSRESYFTWHHALGHNVYYGVLLSLGLCIFARSRLHTFALCFALFHLHLLMDLFGSGHGWSIYYLYPFSRHSFWITSGWGFSSWQSFTAFFLLLSWTILIAILQRRTPLELLKPSLDRQLVSLLPQ